MTVAYHLLFISEGRCHVQVALIASGSVPMVHCLLLGYIELRIPYDMTRNVCETY